MYSKWKSVHISHSSHTFYCPSNLIFLYMVTLIFHRNVNTHYTLGFLWTNHENCNICKSLILTNYTVLNFGSSIHYAQNHNKHKSLPQNKLKCIRAHKQPPLTVRLPLWVYMHFTIHPHNKYSISNPWNLHRQRRKTICCDQVYFT